MGSYTRWSDQQHDSARPSGQSRQTAGRPATGTHHEAVQAEALQNRLMSDAEFSAEGLNRLAIDVPPVQLLQLDHPVTRRDDVGLWKHETRPFQPLVKRFNSPVNAIMTSGITNSESANTSRGDFAIIPSMAIRSNFPGRPYLEVGQRIEATRLYAKLTVLEMAALMRVAPPRYTVIQYGRALPDAEKLEPLCEHFGLSLDWLFRGDRRLLPIGIAQELDRHLKSLVDEQGQPLRRKPGRPVGTSRKPAKKDPA